MTYKRQVDDARRKQASKVVIRERSEVTPGERGLELYNGSDLPIFSVIWALDASTPEGKEISEMLYRRKVPYVEAFQSLYLSEADYVPQSLRDSASVEFKDASGKKWVRKVKGGLYPHGLPRKYARRDTNKST
jgi:hypothetical protein